MKAIQTEYAGCRFRSRLEARWAVFFDHIAVSWQYEPEGFETPVGRYLPDFFVPEFGKWFEVKPDGMLLKDYDRGRLAHFGSQCLEQGQRLLLLQGMPKPDDFVRCMTWAALPYDEGNISHPLLGLIEGVQEAELLTESLEPQGWIPNTWIPGQDVRGALTAARSARFEHGENG